jgi:hypothetical protein
MSKLKLLAEILTQTPQNTSKQLTLESISFEFTINAIRLTKLSSQLFLVSAPSKSQHPPLITGGTLRLTKKIPAKPMRDYVYVQRNPGQRFDFVQNSDFFYLLHSLSSASE